MSALTRQDGNLEQALASLQSVKIDVAQLIGSNRGGSRGMHGFIAESAEVGIQNARSLVRGLEPAYRWVNDNGPVDLYRDLTPIQQKFVQANGHFGLEAIEKHMADYPGFMKAGGRYMIPKDFHAQVQRMMSLSQEEAAKESAETYRLWQWIHAWFDRNDLTMEQLEPSALDYADAQAGNIHKTLEREEKDIRAEDGRRREGAYEASRPSLKQGAQVAAVSAALEGGIEFVLGIWRLRQTKRFQEFTAQDWQRLGLDTAGAAARGGVRGGVVYALSNLAGTSAPMANAFVTAAFGVAAQAYHLNKGRITADEFIQNAEVLCVDVAVSTLSSVLGQTLIPIPVVGAVIGNVAGTYLYQIGKNYLSRQEQQLIAAYREEQRLLDRKLTQQYRKFLGELQREFSRFQTLMDLAFDRDCNLALSGSVALARTAGVSEQRILKDKQDIDRYFLE